ncbi:hypothetical protein SAMN05216262_11653 [Colwellia chukchiensis]|uniref:Uncharacterized protein n=1 Tax=Colwellia chukchiensis TaxID=641665 RepID=A0A1H7RXM3_9GAMM|nr:hypothetical protein SAMN05216262_11653 [Colwellia chukchiensis]
MFYNLAAIFAGCGFLKCANKPCYGTKVPIIQWLKYANLVGK